MTTAIYTTEGVLLTIYGAAEGLSLVVPDHMTIAAIERHIAEVIDWLS